LEKIFDDPKAVQKNSELVETVKQKYEGFVTLLDLANEFLQNKELSQKLPVPMYIIEESKIVPQMKPRFYSIVNDPFPNGATTTQSL
jgi:sulfite reductase alpha subunit-like flavoprotein